MPLPQAEPNPLSDGELIPRDKVPWTVMVYLAGDNNLSEECVYGLVEMKKAKCDKQQINIIAQFDSSDEFLPTRRYEINSKGAETSNGPLSDDRFDESHFNLRTKEVHFEGESKNANQLASDRKRDKAANFRRFKAAQKKGRAINQLPTPDPSRGGLDDTDTASQIQLYNFLSFCVQRYPADHYMVVLSGHGAGTERDYFLKDEGSAGYLTFNELKLAFEQLHEFDLNKKKLDIIGLDSCLMSMAEVCYELRDLTEIVVGCESYAPAAGWPYRSIFEALNGIVKAVPETPPKAMKRDDQAARFAKAVVEKYVAFYADYTEGGLSVTQSALDLNQLPDLKVKISSLVETLATELETEFAREQAKQEDEAKAYPFRDALVLAHWEAQSYNGESYVDIADFCDCLTRRSPSGGVVANACRDLAQFIREQFVLRSRFNGSVYQYSHGVSIYFPWSTVALYYLNLDFAKDSGWARFLATYADLTRRQPRQPPISRAATQADFDQVVENNSWISRDLFNLASGKKIAHDSVSSESASVKTAIGETGLSKMGSGKMGSGKMGSGKMGSGKMGSGKESNPIHSMRNPAIAVASFGNKAD